jgi:hypothetical protein
VGWVSWQSTTVTTGFSGTWFFTPLSFSWQSASFFSSLEASWQKDYENNSGSNISEDF